MSELVKKVKLEAMKTLKSAMASHEDGRWDEAAQLYTAIVVVLPESADAWALCGLLKYQRGYKPEAAKLFKKALSLNQEQPIAKNFFTQIENDVNVDVKSYCSDTIDREYVIEKLFEISNSQDHRSSDDKAKQDEEMRQLDSPIARDNLSKGLVLQEAGRVIEALALISKAAEIEPRSPYLRFRLGNLLGSLWCSRQTSRRSRGSGSIEGTGQRRAAQGDIEAPAACCNASIACTAYTTYTEELMTRVGG